MAWNLLATGRPVGDWMVSERGESDRRAEEDARTETRGRRLADAVGPRSGAGGRRGDRAGFDGGGRRRGGALAGAVLAAGLLGGVGLVGFDDGRGGSRGLVDALGGGGLVAGLQRFRRRRFADLQR